MAEYASIRDGMGDSMKIGAGDWPKAVSHHNGTTGTTERRGTGPAWSDTK